MIKTCKICKKKFKVKNVSQPSQTCGHKCGKQITWKKVQLYWKKRKAGLSTT